MHDRHNTAEDVVGRAKTVLVFSSAAEAVAVVSSVIVQPCEGAGKDRLCIKGPVSLEPQSRAQLESVVIPLLDRLMQLLGMPCPPLEVSFVNLSAAAVSGLNLQITGFSLDIAVFAAGLSACLQIPLPQDIAFTGHLGSTDGDVRQVQNLPAKIKAAAADPGVRRLIYPSLEKDASLQVLTPIARDEIAAAISAAKSTVRTTAVSDVAEVIQAVFLDKHLIQASLRRGFYGNDSPAAADSTILERVARQLLDNHTERFWAVLERQLLEGRGDRAQELLKAYADFHIARNIYPAALGSKLYRLIQSLPPALRRLKKGFPLLSKDVWLRLSRFAQDDDIEDARMLYDALLGDAPIVHSSPPREDCALKNADQWESAELELLLSELSAENLWKRRLKSAAGGGADENCGTLMDRPRITQAG